ncbi:MAG: hypothetical protein ACJ8J7_08615 [Sulfurifustaceae bacterium]
MVEPLKSWRHLFSAVLALSTDGGTVERRLEAAFTGNLQKIVPDRDLPHHLREDFAKLMHELTDLFGDGNKHNDSRRASLLAKKVVALYDRVTKEL